MRVRAPEVPEALARDVAAAVEALRGLELYKPPGCRRDDRLGRGARRARRARLDERSVDVTLGTILKYREDQERVRAHGLAGARRRGGRAQCLTVGADRRPERIAVAFARVLRGARARRCRSVRDARRSRARSRAVGLAPTASGVYWAGRATLVTRPEDSRDRTTARFARVLGPARGVELRIERRRSRSCSRSTYRRRRRRRRPTTGDEPIRRAGRHRALEPDRGAAPPRLRRLHRRPSSSRRAG